VTTPAVAQVGNATDILTLTPFTTSPEFYWQTIGSSSPFVADTV
jgi:hypothetical protein